MFKGDQDDGFDMDDFEELADFSTRVSLHEARQIFDRYTDTHFRNYLLSFGQKDRAKLLPFRTYLAASLTGHNSDPPTITIVTGFDREKQFYSLAEIPSDDADVPPISLQEVLPEADPQLPFSIEFKLNEDYESFPVPPESINKLAAKYPTDLNHGFLVVDGGTAAMLDAIYPDPNLPLKVFSYPNDSNADLPPRSVVKLAHLKYEDLLGKTQPVNVPIFRIRPDKQPNGDIVHEYFNKSMKLRNQMTIPQAVFVHESLKTITGGNFSLTGLSNQPTSLDT